MVNRGGTEAMQKTKPHHPLRTQVYALTRWLHLYTSMISLLVVLFFAATGVTLNHPDWLFGSTERVSSYQGTLPESWQRNSQVNWLETAETLRARYNLKGSVSDTRADDQEASISFRAPAYAADAFISIKDGSYTLKVTAQGPVAVLNDLHRGRDAGSAWAWLIDLSGGFLLLVALTGLTLSLFFKKTRRAAMLTALAGTLVVVVMMWQAG
ncbi:MAG: PepSY-associated TM helix domain-containing protein [Meiothermus sp.]|nr:PepSY-associated TM helix domain-containing protein [Meiothermus sp.]